MVLSPIQIQHLLKLNEQQKYEADFRFANSNTTLVKVKLNVGLWKILRN